MPLVAPQCKSIQVKKKEAGELARDLERLSVGHN